MVTGNAIPSFNGKKLRSCSFLNQDAEYVGFNGNGVRKGQGYLLTSEGGWLAKASFPVVKIDQFLDDLSDLAKFLGLIVVGVDRNNRFIDLNEIKRMGASPAGTRARRRLHVRVYTAADYLNRWSGCFQDVIDATNPPQSVDPRVEILAKLQEKRISRRELASAIGADHSFLSKVLNGKKSPPKGLLREATAYLRGTSSNHDQREAPGEVVIVCNFPGSRKTLCGEALRLRAQGWSIVPQLPGKKMPCVKWKPFQDRLPTEQEIVSWFKKWPKAGWRWFLGRSATFS